jgi:hypothetical protein
MVEHRVYSPEDTSSTLVERTFKKYISNVDDNSTLNYTIYKHNPEARPLSTGHLSGA